MRCLEAKVSSLKVKFRKCNNLNIKKMQILVALLVLMEEDINSKKTHCNILMPKNPPNSDPYKHYTLTLLMTTE